MKLDDRAVAAEGWVRAAWKLSGLLERLESPPAFQTKDDTSPVTAADHAIEGHLRQFIESGCPTDGILGEEMGHSRADSRAQWIIDPIDGTKAFMAGFASFTTLLSFAIESSPQLGIVYQPTLDLCFTGGMDVAARCNGRSIHTRACTRLEDAFLSTTSPFYFSKTDRPRIADLINHARWHQLGGDGFAYARLACGRIDAVVESGLQPYDFMAHAALITAAGGVITDWQGNALHLGSDGTVCAAGDGRLHENLLEELNR